MSAGSSPVPAQAELQLGTKLAFGVGQVAEGLKNRTVQTFLFFYYVQVLGLPPELGGRALLIAVLWDAITDPVTGSISDHHRSRWGRRHPFMYGAALPLAASFVLLFLPPQDLGQTGLFLWLVAFSLLTRTALTVYHIPHMALGAELSSDYHERTSVVAYRSWFQLVAGASVTPIAFTLFFRASERFENGQLDPDAYAPFAFFFGCVMVVTVLLSAVGTHSRIPYLPTGSAYRVRLSARRVIREFREALHSPSFRYYLAAILAYAVGGGLQGVLELHMLTFFWAIAPEAIRNIALVSLVGVLLGVPFWNRASRRLGKKRTFITGVAFSGVFHTLPPVALLLGYFPAHESPLYIPLLAALSCIATFGSAASLAVGGSLMADLTDEHELETGQRRAGVFFGVIAFASKATPAIGIWLAGAILQWIGFPTGAAPGEVPTNVIRQLGWTYGPGVFVLVILAGLLMSRYSITQERLEAIQEQLRARRAQPAR